MPLFMDYHQFDNVTIEEVKTAHIADLKIQDEYGVKYHQFWVNEEAGSVFCLIEGPDKETCELVHRLAHGVTACSITEIQQGFYKLAMGNTVQSQGGVATFTTGEVDIAYRSILVVSIRALTSARDSNDVRSLLLPIWAKNIVMEKFRDFGGRGIEWGDDDSLIAIFNDAKDAYNCANSIQKELCANSEMKPKIIYKMGLSAGQPVTEHGDFFDKVLKLSSRLCNAALDNQLLVSALIAKLAKIDTYIPSWQNRVVVPAEERLLSDIFNITESRLSDLNLGITNLCESIGISRPQFYRKITAITGRSPVYFLRDIRLEKARTLLQQKTGNVTQVAMEVGYSNPSYFTKCYTEKFGCLPSLH
ncbi:DUF4242 domain-containing protein [Algoriphagus sp. D3-2-R+10]|uniref:nickel-binding protein n=1 Tax=Algoriphagus aurantiacus TaxID=3103948 RepID=UPI002B37331D|nr:nickel-binding protein [Algoriphagus sp. D3-2-R+10]MEB2776638.1 DUF4242 domain-containing protein [Algoriphagus sp. D3-2-R+10]